MPMLVLVVFVGLVSGLLVRPVRRATALTAVVSVFVVASAVWTLVDGNGEEPGWFLGATVVAVAAAIGLTRVGASVRGSRT